MPGGREEKVDGILLVDCDLAFPGFRTAYRTDDDADPATAYAAACDRLGGRGDGFLLMARTDTDDDLADAATAAGAFVFGAGSPEMVCRARLADVDTPSGATMRRVDDAAGEPRVARIAGEAFAALDFPADQVAASFANADSLLRDDIFMYLAWLDDEPVAAAMSVLTPSNGAYISWVAALEAARRRGLGEAVTRAATNAGFDAGATFASLEASHMGEPIYARMGYDTLYRYRFVVTLARAR